MWIQSKKVNFNVVWFSLAVLLVAFPALVFGLDVQLPTLSTNFLEKAENDTFMQGMPGELTSCILSDSYRYFEFSETFGRVQNISELSEDQKDSSEPSNIDCIHTEYLFHLFEIRNFYSAERKSGLKPERALRVDSISASTTYASVFEQYIVKSRPFRGDLGDDVRKSSLFYSSDLKHKIVDILKDCPSNGFRGYMIRSCKSKATEELDSIFNNIMIPRFASVNYMRQLKHSFHESLDRRFSSDYKNDWPALLLTKPNSPEPVFQCPAHMHHIILAGYAKITIRVFSTKSAAEHFFPYYDESSPLHYPQFKLHGFSDSTPYGNEGSDSHNDQLPAFSEVTLGAGEYLFVPNQMLSSIRAADFYGDNDATIPYIIICSVDASNLNSFRHSISWYSAVSSFDHSISQQISSSHFIHNIDKNAVDVTLASYNSDAASQSIDGEIAEASTAQKKVDRRDRKKRASGGSDFKDWQETSKWNLRVTASTLIPPSGVNILNVGRSNVTIAWHSVFVPSSADRSAFSFVVSYCIVGERSLRLPTTIFSDYDQKIDESNCSSVAFDRSHGVQSNLMEKVDQKLLLQTGEIKTLFEANIPHLRSSTTYQLKVHYLYDQHHSPYSSWTIPCTTLEVAEPSVPLSASSEKLLTIANSNSMLNLQEISSSFEYVDGSVPLAVPKLSAVGSSSEFKPHLALYFRSPADDGGSRILGYHIWARTVELVSSFKSKRKPIAQQFSHWIWLGTYFATPTKGSEDLLSIEIYNLLPRAAYQFRVAAYNAIGDSPSTFATNTITFDPESLYTEFLKNYKQPNTLFHHVFYARGHERHYGPATNDFNQLFKSDTHIKETSVGANIILNIDFRSETISMWPIQSEHEKFPMWRSHSTSPTISVRGMALISDLKDILGNEDPESQPLRGRVCFVQRGSIPIAEKAMKAQRIGAAAVIIVDNEECVSYDQSCLPGANRDFGEGFGAMDVPALWKSLFIPVGFILRQHFDNIFINGVQSSIDSSHSEL